MATSSLPLVQAEMKAIIVRSDVSIEDTTYAAGCAALPVYTHAREVDAMRGISRRK